MLAYLEGITQLGLVSYSNLKDLDNEILNAEIVKYIIFIGKA